MALGVMRGKNVQTEDDVNVSLQVYKLTGIKLRFDVALFPNRRAVSDFEHFSLSTICNFKVNE